MGTWTCRPFSANQSGGSWTLIGAATLLDAINAQGSGVARAAGPTYATSFNIESSPDNGGGISLDGGGLISFASVPAGFHVDSAQVNVRFATGGSAEPSNPGGFKIHLQWQGANIGALVDCSGVSNTDFSRTITPTPTTLGTFFATSFGIDHDGSSGLGGFSTLDIDRLWISGTYSIQNYTWYVEEIEEEHEGQKFVREELTQVFEGDPPPDNAIPVAAPNVDPTFQWWKLDLDDIELWLYQVNSPGPLWVIDTFPNDYGWWKSFEEFQGGALLIVRGNPKKPRTFEEITTFSDHMGGFPGCGTVYNFKLVYAARDYDDAPIVRIFDGLSDRELCRVPPVSGVDAVAIMSMITLNGTVYLTTLDAGTTGGDCSSATYSGRVFELDVPSASLTQIGAQFTGGDLPYALAWHEGKLWCGTNPDDDGSESGNIYWFRPEVDTVWTLDKDLSVDVDHQVAGGCTGLCVYQGGLVVTLSAPAGQEAPLHIRGLTEDVDGNRIAAPDEYVWWGGGLGDDAGNYWGSPVVYLDNLYATYWDSTYGTSVMRLDPDGFHAVLGPLGSTVAPLGLYLGSGNLYALFGGFDQPLRFWGTEDGDVWDDLTDFLPGHADQKAAPVFAEVKAS